MLSVVIPSRNEIFLKQTVLDLLHKATQEIEVVCVLDDCWVYGDDLIDDKRVHYIHFTNSKGMRAGINAGVAIANGDYILKTDGHCLFDKGFDEKLVADCKDDWVVVPRRYPLDPEKWAIEERTDNKYPIDYMFLTYPNDDKKWGGREFSGREWRQKNDDPDLKAVLIDDLMSFQGSCWMMKKSYYEYLELMDEDLYGGFWKEAQEIGFKAWTSGGRVVRNKKTWYAHLYKGRKYGRGYKLSKANNINHRRNIQNWMTKKMWHKQKYPLSYMINKFPDAPMWTPDRIKECDYGIAE